MPVSVDGMGVLTVSSLGSSGAPTSVLRCHLMLEGGAPIHRPWSSLALVPNRTGTVVFSQAKSNKLLVASVPSAASAGSPVLCFGAHSSAVSACAASASGALLASATAQGQIKVWQVYDGSEIACVDEGHVGRVTALMFLGPCHLASGGEDGLVHVWDWSSHGGGAPLRLCEVVQMGPHPAPITALGACMPDGSIFAAAAPDAALAPARVAVARADGLVGVYRMEAVPWDPLRPRLREEARIALPEGRTPRSLDWSVDGAWLAVAAEASAPTPHSANPYSAGTVLLYRSEGWACRAEVPLSSACVMVRFLPYVSCERQGSFFLATRAGGMQIRSTEDAAGATLSGRAAQLNQRPATPGPGTDPRHAAMGATRRPAILEEDDLRALERITVTEEEVKEEQQRRRGQGAEGEAPMPRSALAVQPVQPAPRNGSSPGRAGAETIAAGSLSAGGGARHPQSPEGRDCVTLSMSDDVTLNAGEGGLTDLELSSSTYARGEEIAEGVAAGRFIAGRLPDVLASAYNARHARCLEPHRRHLPFPCKAPLDPEELAAEVRQFRPHFEQMVAATRAQQASASASLARPAPLASAKLAQRLERERTRRFPERTEEELRADARAGRVVRVAALASTSAPTAYGGLVPVLAPEDGAVAVQPRRVAKQVDPRWKEQRQQSKGLPVVADFLQSIVGGGPSRGTATTSVPEIFRVPLNVDRQKIVQQTMAASMGVRV